MRPSFANGYSDAGLLLSPRNGGMNLDRDRGKFARHFR